MLFPMKPGVIYYFYGNWDHINGYIGEPQKTILLLIGYLRKEKCNADIVRDLQKVKKVPDYRIIIFGRFLNICIRTLFCLIHGIHFNKIHFIIFKDKAAFSDIVFFLRNIDSIVKLQYILDICLLEIGIPKKLYRYLLKKQRRKILFASFPTDLVRHSRIFLSSSLEKNRLEKIVSSKHTNFNTKNVKVLYFGKDSYLCGVDVIHKLNGRFKHYNLSAVGIFPFKGYLAREGINSEYHIYANDTRILEKVKIATFTLFPYRSKFGGPDIPATLIESFLLGTPPIISKVLLFDILEKHDYPLVIDSISAASIKKSIERHIKNNQDYTKLLRTCLIIRQEIIEKYGYTFFHIDV